MPIAHDLGVSLGAAAVVASAYFLAYGLSQPLWGALSDRLGRVAVLRLALAGGAVCAVAAAAAPALVPLVLARTAAGFCFAAVMPSAMTYVGDTVATARRQGALAVLMAFATSGVAAGTLVGGVAAELVGWRAAFLVSTALACGALVVLRGLAEPAREHPRAPLLAQVRALVRHRWVHAVLGLAFVEGAVIFGALTFLAASLQDGGVGAAVAGSAAAGFGVANAACTPLVTRAAARVASPLLIAGGGAFAAAGLLAAAVAPSTGTAVAAACGLGAGFGFLHSTMQLWATQVQPEARALTVAFFAGAVFSGGAVVAAVAGPLAADGRFSLIFALAAAGAAVLAVAGGLLRGRYVASLHPPAAATAPAAP